MDTVKDGISTAAMAAWPDGRRSKAGALCAASLSLLFLVSGIWKLTDLEATAERMTQALIPAPLSMPTAFAAAIFETFAGVLLLIPRFRRWGAWLAGGMLIAFMIYIGVLYQRLIGDECNCFPWIQRVVGPAFFVGDAAMLALAAAAGWWSTRSTGLRRAAAILASTCLVAFGSYAVSLVGRGRADAPETAMADGRPTPLRRGRVLLYFFDPECTHCLAVAREMSKRNWGDTRIIVLATRVPQFAAPFLQDSGLRAAISPDAEKLRRSFPFTDPPYAVALERGKAAATFNSGQLESETYYTTLQRLGYLK
jgi:uncharacterized membrane protein